MKFFSRRVEKVQPILTVKRNSDGFYVINLKDSLICYTRKEADANKVVYKLSEIDWKKYNFSLDELIKTDNEYYQASIRETLRKYSAPMSYNGNYLITKDENDQVEYKTSDESKVVGNHVANGLAYRVVSEGFKLDVIYGNLKLKVMPEKKHINEFFDVTNSIIPWYSSKAIEIIRINEDIKSFLLETQEAVIEGTPLPHLNSDIRNSLDYAVFGLDDEIRKEAYVTSMRQLDQMEGLKQVKNSIKEFVRIISANKELERASIETQTNALHSLYVGPPGTGKTEVARIMKDIFWSLDLISDRKLIEVSREDLVGVHLGETEEKTKNIVEKALGGILFVDEAYTLYQGSTGASTTTDYGKDALEGIMRAMENNRDNLVVIFAGYKKQIDSLLAVNPGLRSRFNFEYRFEEYSPSELAAIADHMLVSQGYDTSLIKGSMLELMKNKAKTGALNGNARDVRVIVDTVIRKHKYRITEDPFDIAVIKPDDVNSLADRKTIKESEGLTKLRIQAEKELEALIGLNDLKNEIQSWANYITIEKRRSDLDKSTSVPRMHMSFEGSPGVGKTTVARIIAKILKGNGLLSSGHFKEIQGKDLVAQYMGHTAAKVDDIIEEASGGILFIDEAYSIVEGENDTFGKEAVNKLISEMENRGEDLVIILAGYKDDIERLFESNDGFSSRIAQRFFFPDYNEEELSRLFELQVAKNNLILDSEAIIAIKEKISVAKRLKVVDGNGRWIRNLLDKIKYAQANRIIKENSNDLHTLTSSDIVEGANNLIKTTNN